MQERELVGQALFARMQAYAPYSGFRVGACLVDKEGHVFTACNVENASYGLSLCAERNAIARAVAEGSRTFSMLAVASDAKDYTMPCGACRQVLYEFAPDLVVLAADCEGRYRRISLAELLPHGFSLDQTAFPNDRNR